ncbi:hypothetical protein O3P69_014768 [Scylla paramamosain]|uniref:Pacifastin domain-containing protein n=1 Tax=Scylla paramamosain TaxID=85552 RepID=A0AAW0TXS5_SCYPA
MYAPCWLVHLEWCRDSAGEGRWLDDCHWCRCDTADQEDETVHICTREESCMSGLKEWPECSGHAHWQRDCNTCFCTGDGKAACTKKLCQPGK